MHCQWTCSAWKSSISQRIDSINGNMKHTRQQYVRMLVRNQDLTKPYKCFSYAYCEMTSSFWLLSPSPFRSIEFLRLSSTRLYVQKIFIMKILNKANFSRFRCTPLQGNLSLSSSALDPHHTIYNPPQNLASYMSKAFENWNVYPTMIYFHGYARIHVY